MNTVNPTCAALALLGVLFAPAAVTAQQRTPDRPHVAWAEADAFIGLTPYTAVHTEKKRHAGASGRIVVVDGARMWGLTRVSGMIPLKPCGQTTPTELLSLQIEEIGVKGKKPKRIRGFAHGLKKNASTIYKEGWFVESQVGALLWLDHWRDSTTCPKPAGSVTEHNRFVLDLKTGKRQDSLSLLRKQERRALVPKMKAAAIAQVRSQHLVKELGAEDAKKIKDAALAKLLTLKRVTPVWTDDGKPRTRFTFSGDLSTLIPDPSGMAPPVEVHVLHDGVLESLKQTHQATPGWARLVWRSHQREDRRKGVHHGRGWSKLQSAAQIKVIKAWLESGVVR